MGIWAACPAGLATATQQPPTLHVRTQHAPFTGTSTYAQKSCCGHPRCDLAPLTTSFGTVGQWERQHLAMAATTSPEVVEWASQCDLAPAPGNGGLETPPLSTQRHHALCRTCQLPRSTLQCSGRSRRTDLSTADNGYSYSVHQVHPAWIRRLRFLVTSTQPGCPEHPFCLIIFVF